MIYVKSKKILFLLKDNIPRKGNSCEKNMNGLRGNHHYLACLDHL